jgi:hypothetical protein
VTLLFDSTLRKCQDQIRCRLQCPVWQHADEPLTNLWVLQNSLSKPHTFSRFIKHKFLQQLTSSQWHVDWCHPSILGTVLSSPSESLFHLKLDQPDVLGSGPQRSPTITQRSFVATRSNVEDLWHFLRPCPVQSFLFAARTCLCTCM